MQTDDRRHSTAKGCSRRAVIPRAREIRGQRGDGGSARKILVALSCVFALTFDRCKTRRLEERPKAREECNGFLVAVLGLLPKIQVYP